MATLHGKKASAKSAPVTQGAPSVLPIHFAEDSLTRVSRQTLRRLAKQLGFNETQTVHYALAFLKKELEQPVTGAPESEDYPVLTAAQLQAIRSHQPRRKKKGVIESLIR